MPSGDVRLKGIREEIETSMLLTSTVHAPSSEYAGSLYPVIHSPQRTLPPQEIDRALRKLKVSLAEILASQTDDPDRSKQRSRDASK